MNILTPEKSYSLCWDCDNAYALKCKFHNNSFSWEERLEHPALVRTKIYAGQGGRTECAVYKVVACDHFCLSSRAAKETEMTRKCKKEDMVNLNKRLKTDKKVTAAAATKEVNKSLPKQVVVTIKQKKVCIICGEPSTEQVCDSPICKVFAKLLRKMVV